MLGLKHYVLYVGGISSTEKDYQVCHMMTPRPPVAPGVDLGLCWLRSVRRVAPFQPACPRNRKQLHLPSAAPGPLTPPPKSSLARTRLICHNLICLPKPLPAFHDDNRTNEQQRQEFSRPGPNSLAHTHLICRNLICLPKPLPTSITKKIPPASKTLIKQECSSVVPTPRAAAAAASGGRETSASAPSIRTTSRVPRRRTESCTTAKRGHPRPKDTPPCY